MTQVSDDKAAKLALLSKDRRAMENMSTEQRRAAAEAAEEDGSVPAIPVPREKMLNVPERYGIGSLDLHLKAIPLAQLDALVETIFAALPPVLYICSQTQPRPDGGINIPIVAATYTEINRRIAENQAKETGQSVEAALVTPATVEAELWEASRQMSSYIDPVTEVLWLHGKDCNPDLTKESLRDLILERFTIADYARIPAILIKANMIGGVSDLADLDAQLLRFFAETNEGR